MKYQTVLLAEPTQSGRTQRITIRLPDGQRVFITTARYPQYHYGDTLRIEGKLEEKKVGKESPSTSLRVNSSQQDRTIYTMAFPNITVVPTDNPLINLMRPLRERIIWLFHTSLPQPHVSLLLGIVFGIQEDMPKAFEKVLSNAGVLHVIAASGMNVTMIGAFLALTFGKILKRQHALLATIGVIFLYAALAGFSPSIVRASIMGSLVFAAQIIGRQTLALYGLLLAGFVMLFYQPFLLFDVGFQLSFVATWGLIVFTPLAQSVLNEKEKIGKWIAKSEFSTTFIAQLVTLPILLSTFGSYSPASILANVLLLWTIPILMIIGAVGTVIGFFIPVFGQWVLFLSLPFLIFFEKTVWFFGSLPVGITIEGVGWPVVVGYYLLLLALLVKLNNSNVKSQSSNLDLKS